MSAKKLSTASACMSRISRYPRLWHCLLHGKENSLPRPRNFNYPLGRDPSSLPSALVEKLDMKAAFSLIDDRPISLRFRVSSLIELSELDKAAQVSRLANFILYSGWDTKVLMCNEIIGTMCEAKRHDDALALIHYFFNEINIDPDIVSFKNIIGALCSENRVDDALQLYIRSGIRVSKDISTIRLLTKGLIDTGRVFDALRFVKARTKLRDSVVCSYLIRGFLDLGNHDMAHQMFYLFNHSTRPVRSYGDNTLGLRSGFRPDCDSRREVVDATFVDYWLKQGEDERAMEIYRSILSRNGGQIVCADTGNTLLGILLDNGKQTEAWDLFDAMVTASKTFDRDTFGTMVNACFKLGHFKQALETFKRPEFTRRSSRCYANIISQFCHRGMMSEALDLFEELRSHLYLRPDVATFRSMINGYAKAGRVHKAIAMLKLMAGATLLKFAVHQAL